MKTTNKPQETIEIDYDSKNEMKDNVLFVLDHSWNVLIEQCSEVGASMVLPNFNMGTSLVIQTIIRQGKSMIATSEEIWNKMKDAFMNNPMISQKIEVVIFNKEEELLFGLN